jgi:threonine/homoserine/homoserine lactone efflux protein
MRTAAGRWPGIDVRPSDGSLTSPDPRAMLGIADYGAFCAAILLFLALPGPGTFALLTSTGKGGFRGGAAATAGLIVGDQVLLWLAVAGVAALLASHPMVFDAVRYAGAAYLAWIGLRLLLARDGSTAAPVRIEPRRYAWQAFLITLMNPKAIVFYMAFFPLFIDPATHRGAPTFALMALTIAGITAIYCLLLCAFAGAIGARLRNHPRLPRLMQRAAGVCLVGFGVRLGTQA